VSSVFRGHENPVRTERLDFTEQVVAQAARSRDRHSLDAPQAEGNRVAVLGYGERFPAKLVLDLRAREPLRRSKQRSDDSNMVPACRFSSSMGARSPGTTSAICLMTYEGWHFKPNLADKSEEL
jgi:hypothetical protein